MANPSSNVAVTPSVEEFLAAWEKAHPVNRARALALLRFSGPATDLAKLAERLLGEHPGGASCD